MIAAQTAVVALAEALTALVDDADAKVEGADGAAAYVLDHLGAAGWRVTPDHSPLNAGGAA